MNPFEMVLGIVFFVMVASILRTAIATLGRRRGPSDGADDARLRDEVRALKERVIVLERIATDKNHFLEAEFDRLREEDRRGADLRPEPRLRDAAQ